MKWFQVDADTPNDPRIRTVIRELGPEGFGGLVLLWCHIADHGIRKPGWSIDSAGKPMLLADLIDATKLGEQKFRDLVRVCTSTGHFLKRPWTTRNVIAIPAMTRRADTYTRRRVRTRFEECSERVSPEFANKTTHTKTEHSKKEKSAAAPQAPADNAKVIRTLVGHLLRSADRDATFTDLKETVKAACAEKRIAYDAAVVGTALEQALAQSEKASA